MTIYHRIVIQTDSSLFLYNIFLKAKTITLYRVFWLCMLYVVMFYVVCFYFPYHFHNITPKGLKWFNVLASFIIGTSHTHTHTLRIFDDVENNNNFLKALIKTIRGKEAREKKKKLKKSPSPLFFSQLTLEKFKRKISIISTLH